MRNNAKRMLWGKVGISENVTQSNAKISLNEGSKKGLFTKTLFFS
jgi:hypothetical protein